MKKELSVLYVGGTWEGSTSKNRMMAIKECGCKVIEFNTTQYLRTRNRVLNSISHRFNIGSNVNKLNEELIKYVEKYGFIDVVWVDKGKWITKSTLEQIKALSKAVLVHYTPDPQIVAQKSRAFMSSISFYDFMFTTKPYEFDLYKQRGAKKIELVNQSYDHLKLYPKELTKDQLKKYSAPVSFIGHHEKHYQKKLEIPIKAGVKTKIWGPYWTKRITKDDLLYASVRGEGVWGEDYNTALNAADIGLCLLTKRWPETTTTRTFEIPACGTFMLAERTEDHQSLFEEGVEAEFFASDEEMLEKIQFYTDAASARERIAKAGHERSIKSGYDNRSRMEALIETIKKNCIW